MGDQNGHQSIALAPTGAMVSLPVSPALKGISIPKAKAPEAKEPEEPKAKPATDETPADQQPAEAATKPKINLAQRMKAAEEAASAAEAKPKTKRTRTKAPKVEEPNIEDRVPVGTWTCSSCGAVCSKVADACPNCKQVRGKPPQTDGKPADGPKPEEPKPPEKPKAEEPKADAKPPKPVPVGKGEGYNRFSTHPKEEPGADAKPPKANPSAEPEPEEDAGRKTPNGSPSGRVSINPMQALEDEVKKLQGKLSKLMEEHLELQRKHQDVKVDLEQANKEKARLGAELAKATNAPPPPDPNQPLPLAPGVQVAAPALPPQTSAAAPPPPNVAPPTEKPKQSRRVLFQVILVCLLIGIALTLLIVFGNPLNRSGSTVVKPEPLATATAKADDLMTQADLDAAIAKYPPEQRGHGTPGCWHRPATKAKPAPGLPTIDCGGVRPPEMSDPADPTSKCVDISHCKIRGL